MESAIANCTAGPSVIRTEWEQFNPRIMEWKRDLLLERCEIEMQKEDKDVRNCEFVMSSIKFAIEHGCEPSYELVELLIMAYKQIVETKRSAWNSIETDAVTVNEPIINMVEMKRQIQTRYMDKAIELARLLEQYVIPKEQESLQIVLYTQFLGDEFRDLIDMSEGKDKDDAMEICKLSYENSFGKLREVVIPTDPFYLEIGFKLCDLKRKYFNQPKEACQLLENIYCEAIQNIEKMDISTRNETQAILLDFLKHMDLWRSAAKTTS